MALTAPIPVAIYPLKMDRQTLIVKALSGRAEVYHFLGRLKTSLGDFNTHSPVILSPASP
jgi:hypothetical protein